MNWLALSPAEIAAVWAGLAGLALWLYLHHRRPQRRRVSTLRFWISVQPITQPRRRKLREPWALLAQVLFLLLLILALANPRLGATFEGRSVVIVFDASIWSRALPTGGTPWIDQEREEAQRILNSLPTGDRVLLLRAEDASPPILPFTTDRVALRLALANVQLSSGIADVPAALAIGKAALAGSRRGLLVYVGPGIVDEDQARGFEEFRTSIETPGQPQFLVRLVGGDTPLQDHGITRLSLRRDAAQPDRWHLLTQMKNYGDAKADLVMKLSINGAPLGQRKVTLAPNELANAEDEFTWNSGGMLEAELSPSDVLDADNRAFINLPIYKIVHVVVITYEDSPFSDDLVAVLVSNPFVRASTVHTGTVLDFTPDVSIYQGTRLPSHLDNNSIWFLSGAPTTVSAPVRVTQWNSQHPVTRWIRTRDVSVRNPAKLQVLPGDTVLAYAEGNPPAPLILARRQDGHRLLIIGFDPVNSNFTAESAFPLFMAAGVEWLTQSVDDEVESHSTGELDFPGPATRIVAPSGKDMSFVRQGDQIHLIAQETGIYRIIAPGGETAIAVNTPLLPSQRLKVTPTEAAAVEPESFRPDSLSLWRGLALLGIVALWLEWWLYYNSREQQRGASIQEIPVDKSLLDGVDRQATEQNESESRAPISMPR